MSSPKTVTTTFTADTTIKSGEVNTNFTDLSRAMTHDILNYSIDTSVAGNALTITLEGSDGNALSASNPGYAMFRNSTAATGTPVVRTITSNITLTISSGSTLGHTSARDSYIYVYLLDNSGTLELIASSMVFDSGSLQTTTAEGGAGAADDEHTLYSTTARASVPIKLIGRLKSNQAAAGTWNTAISEESLTFIKEKIAARYEVSGSQAVANGATDIRDFATKIFDTHSAVTTGALWKFIAPRKDIFSVSSSIIGQCAGGDWDEGDFVELRIYKGGVLYATLSKREAEASPTALVVQDIGGTALVKMDKDEVLDIRITNECGVNWTSTATAKQNHVSIHSI